MVSQRDGPPNTSVHRRFGGVLTRHVEKRQHRFENRERQEEAYKSNFSRTIKCAVLWCEVRGFGFDYGINFRMRIQCKNSSRIKFKRADAFAGQCTQGTWQCRRRRIDLQGFGPLYIYDRARSKLVRKTSWGEIGGLHPTDVVTCPFVERPPLGGPQCRAARSFAPGPRARPRVWSE